MAPAIKWYDIIHFLMGFFCSLLNVVNPLLAFQALVLFCMYELLQQLRVLDFSFRDVFAFGIGWAAGALLYVL